MNFQSMKSECSRNRHCIASGAGTSRISTTHIGGRTTFAERVAIKKGTVNCFQLDRALIKTTSGNGLVYFAAGTS